MKYAVISLIMSSIMLKALFYLVMAWCVSSTCRF